MVYPAFLSPLRRRPDRMRLPARGRLQGGEIGAGLAAQKLAQDRGLGFARGCRFGFGHVCSSVSRASGMLALVPRCARGPAGRGISDARVGREVQSGDEQPIGYSDASGTFTPIFCKVRVNLQFSCSFMLFLGLKSRANLEHDTDCFEQRRFVALQAFFAERKISSFDTIKLDRPTVRVFGLQSAQSGFGRSIRTISDLDFGRPLGLPDWPFFQRVVFGGVPNPTFLHPSFVTPSISPLSRPYFRGRFRIFFRFCSRIIGIGLCQACLFDDASL